MYITTFLEPSKRQLHHGAGRFLFWVITLILVSIGMNSHDFTLDLRPLGKSHVHVTHVAENTSRSN